MEKIGGATPSFSSVCYIQRNYEYSEGQFSQKFKLYKFKE